MQVACPAHAEFVICDCTIEDFHQVLKTGCQIERRQMRSVEALWRLTGILTPLAVRLLMMRDSAQQAPDTPASEAFDPHVVQVVTWLAQLPSPLISVKQMWHAIARLGGYFDRKSDGSPGWKTVWKGWHSVQAVLQGVRLALSLSSS